MKAEGALYPTLVSNKKRPAGRFCFLSWWFTTSERSESSGGGENRTPVRKMTCKRFYNA